MYIDKMTKSAAMSDNANCRGLM